MIAISKRITALRGARRFVAALLAGGALALTQAPVSWPILLFVALPVLLWLLDGTAGPVGGFGIGWAAGVGYFGGALFWIVDPFLVDPESYGWMAPIALIGMAGGMALFWGVPFGLARMVWRPGASRVVLLACAWTLAEFARGHVLTGFPWALHGYAWVETPVIQTVALFGPYMLGFLTLIAGLSVGLATWRGIGVAGMLVAMGWGFGAWRLAQPLPERAEPVLVRLVQPNAVQSEKWLPGKEEEFYRRHLSESLSPAEPRPDVTIWSETAVSFILGYHPELQAEAAAAAAPGQLILGMRRVDVMPEGGEDWYNSLVALRADGAPVAVYDKYHLVPFGEYIPYGHVLGRLGLPALTTLTRSGFTAGPGPRVLSVPGLPPFLPVICYEAIFPQGMRAPGERPEWIVQITNDAWFGETSGPYQHLAQARIRAIEQGLPLARAANTGISAMIDPHGRIIASLGLGLAGHVDAPLPAALPPTFYSRLPEVTIPVSIAIIFVLTFTNILCGISYPRRG